MKKLLAIAIIALFAIPSAAHAAPVSFPVQVVSSRGYAVPNLMFAANPSQAPGVPVAGVLGYGDSTGTVQWQAEAGTAPNITVFNGRSCPGGHGMEGPSGTNTTQRLQPAAAGAQQTITLPTIQAAFDAASWNRSQTGTVTDAEAQTLQLINAYRKAQGLSEVKMLKRLNYIAIRHAAWMSSESLLTHCGDMGYLPVHRALQAGVVGTISENAGGTSSFVASPKEMMDSWLASPGHKALLDTPSAQYVGVGVVGGYFVTDFMLSACKELPGDSICTDITPQAVAEPVNPTPSTTSGAKVSMTTAKLTKGRCARCWALTVRANVNNASQAKITRIAKDGARRTLGYKAVSGSGLMVYKLALRPPAGTLLSQRRWILARYYKISVKGGTSSQTVRVR